MLLFAVYDEKGDMFEVTPAKAKELVIEYGWSMEKGKATGIPESTGPAKMPTFINRAVPESDSPAEPVEPAEPLVEKPVIFVPFVEPEPAHMPVMPVHEPEPMHEPANVQSDEIHQAPTVSVTSTSSPVPVAANLRAV